MDPTPLILLCINLLHLQLKSDRHGDPHRIIWHSIICILKYIGNIVLNWICLILKADFSVLLQFRLICFQFVSHHFFLQHEHFY